MRYTTTIVITEVKAVWRNANASRLYTWMACGCGYHDNDRDLLRASLGVMAAETGLTISAVRNGLKLLQRHNLVRRVDGNQWHVAKWIAPEKPSARPKASVKGGDVNTMVDRMEAEVRAYQNKVMEAVRRLSIDELRVWASELEAGKQTAHGGVRIKPTADNVQWLRKVIDMRH